MCANFKLQNLSISSVTTNFTVILCTDSVILCPFCEITSGQYCSYQPNDTYDPTPH